MKNLTFKLVCSSLVLSAAALLTSPVAAQTPLLIGAGSSALYNTISASFFGGSGAVCGPNHWTYKGGAIGSTTETSIVDTRSALIANEPATVTVAWDGAASGVGAHVVCAYFQVDSTVGVRAALARTAAGTPAAQPFLAAGTVGLAGAGKVPNQTADSPLPANIQAAVNASYITFAGADIRAEDAKFATVRALAAQGANVNTVPNSGSYVNALVDAKGLGYANGADVFACAGDNTTPIGFPIGSVAGTLATPIDFALFGTDPITCGAAAPYFRESNIGAGPIVVFVNTQNAAAGHLGDANLQNISSEVFAGFLNGTFSRTRDLFTNYAAGTIGSFGVKTWLREPLSGTYNVTEYNIPNTNRFSQSQEDGVTGGPYVTPFVAGSSNNPLSLTNANGVGGRYRAVGTGENVKAVANAANLDSLGYAFWGYGNFSLSNIGAVTNVRYLTLDGVDPLYGASSANPNGPGVFPEPVSGVYPALSFPNVVNGSYPAWTTFRIVSVPEALNTYVQQLITYTQTQASQFYDFVPEGNLNVFHSHFYQTGIGPDNGNTVYQAGPPPVYYAESGGDVGGQVFPTQADFDYLADQIAEGHGVRGLWNRHK